MASTSVVKRTRGPNKQRPWSLDVAAGLAVFPLALDVSDPVHRRLLERQFSNGFEVYRATQASARSRLRAYRAARNERARHGPEAVRERLRLSRKGLEYAAYAHVDAAPHLRRGVTKALAMNLADSVWTACERHLFPDASGRRFGMPRIARWYDFRRLPGRARSQTKANTWESYRLVGTLAGHRAAYTRADGRFYQPGHMPRIATSARSWWGYQGPLAVVFTGLPDGALVLPVRLPTAPSNQARLDHYLGDPKLWHRIDLVRFPDPTEPGGWRYQAHLTVRKPPYVSPATRARREAAAIATVGRRAGIDVNVSNITIASHQDEHDLRVTRVVRSPAARTRSHRRARQERRRSRALDRSRRAANAQRYQLSKRQTKRARRREAAGLPPIQTIPAGPRKARVDGTPVQSYRTDQLSNSFRRQRTTHAARSASAAQARRAYARATAKTIVAEHGARFVTEDVSPATWFRRWGRALASATPGMLVAAIEREARAVAAIASGDGGVFRASTRTTSLSQHCLCGQRVSKELGQRRHSCTACGLQGDRDTIAAVLAAHVVFGCQHEPASATVDTSATRILLDLLPTKHIDYRVLLNQGRQDARSESTASTAFDGFSIVAAERTPDLVVVVARRSVGMAPLPTPDEFGTRQITSDRLRTRTNLSFRVHSLTWDSS